MSSSKKYAKSKSKHSKKKGDKDKNENIIKTSKIMIYISKYLIQNVVLHQDLH